MRSVLIYGDSQTWGFTPKTGVRLAYDLRWTTVMQRGLAVANAPPSAFVIEALNGRTTVRDDPFKPWRNGLTYLELALTSHAPLDLVVLALGSNDLQWQYHFDAPELARGMASLVDKVRSFRRDPTDPVPDVLILAPPRVTQPADFLTDIFRGAAEKTDGQQRRYAALAKSLGTDFLSMADVAKPSPLDGVHLDAQGHAALGAAMAVKVGDWLRNREAGT